MTSSKDASASRKSSARADFDNLDVVPASIDLSGAELEVADMADRNSLLKNAVDEFLATSEEHYDYVIIDCRRAWVCW